MSIYYFESENGDYFSEDRKRRFIRLSGKAAYKYLRENRSEDTYFFKTVTDERDGEDIYVEVPKSAVSVFRGELYHEQYLAKWKKKKGFRIISLLQQIEDQDELTVEDIVPDESMDFEDEVIHEIELEILRRALKSLTDEELKLIHSLFLSESPMPERELSGKLGIPQTTLNSRKKAILQKLKNFF